MATRYLADISGTLNATGAGFAATNPETSWIKAVITAHAPASPAAQWVIGIGTQTGVIIRPLAFGFGQSVSCGPYLLAPGETLVASIVNGGSADNVTGSLFGLQDVDPSNVTMDTAVGSASSVLISGGTVTVTVSGNVPVTITGTPTVNIGNVPAVTISGTPSVTVTSGTINIGNVPAVTVSSGTIAISGTVNVSITGTNTVILGGGSASIGSISAIGSTVTVAGTINIGNTPAVTISGTPNVNISSGTVSITGTPNINIQSQSVNLNTQQPQTLLGNFVVPNNGSNNATYNLPSGTHAVGIVVGGSGVLSTLKIVGVTTGIAYINLVGLSGNEIGPGYYVGPVLSILDTQVQITGVSPVGGGSTTVYSVAILDAEAVFVFDNGKEPVATILVDQTGAPLVAANPLAVAVQAALWYVPNKTPNVNDTGLFAGGANVSLLTAVGGQTIYIFSIKLASGIGGFIGNWSDICINGGTVFARFSSAAKDSDDIDTYGAPWPAGSGVSVTNSTGANKRYEITITYSQG